MANAREDLDLIVDKFAREIVIASGEVLNATNLTNAGGYLRRTPQVIKVDEYLQALEIIVKKGIDISKIKHFIRMELPSYYNLDYYNKHLWRRKKQKKLTQEEYDLVLKVVKEIEDEVK